jgi:hypothetical protein
MTRAVFAAGGVVPERIVTDVFARIEHLAPGNVIMTAQGPRLID